MQRQTVGQNASGVAPTAAHVTCMNESRHTYKWVTSNVWVSHDITPNEKWNIFQCLIVKSVSHVTCVNESRHTHIRESHVTHIYVSHVTCMDESRHTYKWVTSHVWMSHITHMDDPRHVYECVASCVWVRHDTPREWAMRYFSMSRCQTASTTGQRRYIGCLNLQVSFRKRSTHHRALLREMTSKDKAFYASLPPYILETSLLERVTWLWQRVIGMCDMKLPRLLRKLLHTSHVWMSHVTLVSESRHMYGWVTWRIWMIHVTHVWTSHVVYRANTAAIRV